MSGAPVTRRVRDGLLAGAAGGVLMSISTNSEMRLRGREPSRVPIRTLEQRLGINLDKRTELRLPPLGHIASSATFGLVRGLMSGAPLPRPAQEALFAAASFAPDFVIIPVASDDVPAPWRWSGVELAISVLHHGVYAGATIAAYRRLTRS